MTKIRDFATITIILFVSMGADSLIESTAGIISMVFLTFVAFILQATKTEEER